VSYKVYDHTIPAEVAVYKAMRQRVFDCFEEGMTEEQDFIVSIEGMGSKIWDSTVRQRLISGLWREERQMRNEARRAAERAAAKKTEEEQERLEEQRLANRPRVKSQTKQVTSRFKKAKTEKERRWIPGYPGWKIDSKGHVFAPSGEEAKYRANRRFQWCARVKDEDGDWLDRNIHTLMVAAGFLESVESKKARRLTPQQEHIKACGGDRQEAEAEDPELHGVDPETGEAVQ
jgi:hypothetical protein